MFAPEPGTIIAERYRLDRSLGEGGMGMVWVAEDTKLKRPVAVKMMAAHVAAKKKAAARFEREAMAAAQLRSPYIVEVHDYGIHEGRPFMVLELLEGQTLSRRIKHGERMAVEEAALIASQVGKALTTAHQAGIVHRDLKAGNIFLVRDEDDQIAKVFDFGIAKALTETTPRDKLTTDGDLLGTPGYMSPEQLRGDGHIDNRTDLWSLGVILYRALTKTMPFRGEDAGMLVGAILTEQPQLPSVLAPDLPEEIDLFFMKALAKEPRDRYQTARELATAFARAANLKPSRPSLPVVEAGLGEGDPVTPSAPSLSAPTNRSGGWLDKRAATALPTGDTATAVTRTPLSIPMQKGRATLWVGAIVALFAGGGLALYLGGALGSGRAAAPVETAATALADQPVELSPPDSTAAADDPSAAATDDAVEGEAADPEPADTTGEAAASGSPGPSTEPAGGPGPAAAPASSGPGPRPGQPWRPKPSGTGPPAPAKTGSDLFSEPW